MITAQPIDSDATPPAPAAPRFILEPAALGLHDGVEENRLNALCDELESEELIRRRDS